MKALVIGGTGFVGMNLIRALVRSENQVTATRRPRSNTLFARKLGAQLVAADLDDLDSLRSAMRGCDVIFHTAGHYPRYSIDLDHHVDLARRQTRNVMLAASAERVGRVVLTSSVATVGAPAAHRSLSNETDALSSAARESVYFAVKEAIEQEAFASCTSDLVILCPTGIVGEYDVKAGTGFMIVALAHGKLPFYINGKTNVIDADDLANAHIAAAIHGSHGERYIIGGHNLTVRELLEHISFELEMRFTSTELPISLARWMATFDEMRCVAQDKGARPFIPVEFVDVVDHGQWVDSSKSQREFHLPPPTPLDRTLRKAVEWYRRYRYIPPAVTRQDRQSSPTSRFSREVLSSQAQ